MSKGDKRPYLKPVTRIELSEENIRSRWILLIILVVIAAVAIGMGIHYAVTVQPGWSEIQVACDEPNYSGEFHLMYDFSDAGGDAAMVNKNLSALYSEVMEESYRIFSKDAQVENFGNLHSVNTHVNETVTIHKTLYAALNLLESHNNRCIYLAPVYVEYNRVFNSESDGEASLYDPRFDAETAGYIDQVMTYAADDAHVSLELLGDNQVRLNVSDAYLAFAEEYGIEEFLDLNWLRNAFVADYVADTLIAKGYTSGYLASFDGYTRSLEKSGQLDFNLFHRNGVDIYVPAKMTYGAPMSIVALRDHPLSDLDRWSYHVYADGSVTSSLINPTDGVCGTSISNLTCYSQNTGCAEILMEMLPVIFADNFAESSLTNLTEQEIYSVWCQEKCVYYNQQGITLEPLENEQGVFYTTEYRP